MPKISSSAARPCGQHLQFVDQVLALHQHALLLFRLHREAQRAGRARNDRDLANRNAVFLFRGDERMTDFMVSDDLLFILRDDHALLFAAGDHVFGRVVEIRLRNAGTVRANGGECGFVQDIRQLRAGCAGRCVRDAFEIDVRLEYLLFRVDVQNFKSAVHIGQLDGDSAVETTGAKQCFIENLGAVRRAQHHDALAGLEAVHFSQQLIQRLFLLVVVRNAAGIALFADCVDFVDEDDARRLLSSLFEQVAHARGARADEHFNELRAAYEKERTARFAGDRLCEQGFAGSGRAYEQRTLRTCAPIDVYFEGFFRISTISISDSFASS